MRRPCYFPNCVFMSDQGTHTRCAVDRLTSHPDIVNLASLINRTGGYKMSSILIPIQSKNFISMSVDHKSGLRRRGRSDIPNLECSVRWTTSQSVWRSRRKACRIDTSLMSWNSQYWLWPSWCPLSSDPHCQYQPPWMRSWAKINVRSSPDDPMTMRQRFLSSGYSNPSKTPHADAQPTIAQGIPKYLDRFSQVLEARCHWGDLERSILYWDWDHHSRWELCPKAWSIHRPIRLPVDSRALLTMLNHTAHPVCQIWAVN